ncbi:hypothetical protein GCM10011379_48460 [Filimonas zeae]|uniref:Uncharacterized protein n=1 Tax=Filimonas zeae TaxID=1737353 RepID=A0A917J4B8_9BACT|nr:hypothetical protein GCM10011379_48460 [Filimonas zeae]
MEATGAMGPGAQGTAGRRNIKELRKIVGAKTNQCDFYLQSLTEQLICRAGVLVYSVAHTTN